MVPRRIEVKWKKFGLGTRLLLTVEYSFRLLIKGKYEIQKVRCTIIIKSLRNSLFVRLSLNSGMCKF